jgi:hypothetical protein
VGGLPPGRHLLLMHRSADQRSVMILRYSCSGYLWNDGPSSWWNWWRIKTASETGGMHELDRWRVGCATGRRAEDSTVAFALGKVYRSEACEGRVVTSFSHDSSLSASQATEGVCLSNNEQFD